MQTKIPQRMIVHFIDYDAPREPAGELNFAREESMFKPLVNALKAEQWYVPVASVEFDGAKTIEENLEVAYRLLQNGVVTDSWTLSPPDGVQPLVDPISANGQEYGHRSMSIGDIVTLGGAQYAVAFAGFIKVA